MVVIVSTSYLGMFGIANVVVVSMEDVMAIGLAITTWIAIAV